MRMLEYQMKWLLGWAEAGLCSSPLDFISDKYNAHMNAIVGCMDGLDVYEENMSA